jgi:hypothetical protein
MNKKRVASQAWWEYWNTIGSDQVTGDLIDNTARAMETQLHLENDECVRAGSMPNGFGFQLLFHDLTKAQAWHLLQAYKKAPHAEV